MSFIKLMGKRCYCLLLQGKQSTQKLICAKRLPSWKFKPTKCLEIRRKSLWHFARSSLMQFNFLNKKYLFLSEKHLNPWQRINDFWRFSFVCMVTVTTLHFQLPKEVAGTRQDFPSQYSDAVFVRRTKCLLQKRT